MPATVTLGSDPFESADLKCWRNPGKFAASPQPGALVEIREELQASLGTAYTIGRELGGGGMSRLFLAEDHTLKRTVVIKLLPPSLASGVSAERFRREVLLVARLQHPHIVPVLASGAAGDAIWYAMPYVNGESLKHRIDRGGALPIDEAVAILSEIADALAYAHRAGVVHRDIKPANVLISEGHAVLADFGIAHAHGSSGAENQSAELTATGMGLGTPRYMAPEQFMEAARVDARADIYSLGILAYEMLTGRSPFEATTGAELLVAHVQQMPVPPRRRRAELPKALNDAVMRALAKNPEDRWRSADEFRQAIAGAQPAPRWSFRRGARIAALATGGAAAIAGVALMPSAAKVPLAVDENTIAVAPFTVLVPQMAMWREGMVDVLSSSLDGWGPLRAVPPSTVMKLSASAADVKAADAIARAASAGIVVFGSLYQSGPDSIRAHITIYHAGRKAILSELDRTDHVTHMDRLTDSITTGALGAIGTARGLPMLPRAARVGTNSMPAIKEFVTGAQLHRSGQFDSAAAHFARAVALDSNFAAAWHGMGQALGWSGGAVAARTPRLRAGSLNRGRAPFDSLTLAVDSIMGALESPGESVNRLAARLFATFDKLTRDYSSDAEAWFNFGDAAVHYGISADTPPTPGEVLAYFDRAMAIDPNLVEAYVHATEFALLANDLPRARSYAERIVQNGPTSPYAQGARNFLELTKRPMDDAGVRRLLGGIDSRVEWLTQVQRLIGGAYIDSAGTMIRVLQQSLNLPAKDEAIPIVWYRTGIARELATHGRLREARAVRADWDIDRDVALARLGLVNADSLSRAMAAFFANADSPLPSPTVFSLWAERGDSLSVARAIDAVKRSRRWVKLDSTKRAETLWFPLTALAVARHDSARALAMLDHAPLGNPAARQGGTWLRGRLLSQRSPAQAARLLGAWGYRSGSIDLEGITKLLFAARTAKRAGDVELAREYYGRVATAWANADPEFFPFVAEARAGRSPR